MISHGKTRTGVKTSSDFDSVPSSIKKRNDGIRALFYNFGSDTRYCGQKRVSSMKHLFPETAWDEILNYPSE
jgi:hypothetical protein